jgi:large subunit ribosomal protein L1
LNHEGGTMAEAKKAAKKTVAKEKKVATKPVVEKNVPEEVVVSEETAAVETPPEPIEEPKTAKAGKRSAKTQKEEQAKQAKEDRKKTTPESKTQTPIKKTSRPKHERAGKKYREAYKLIDRSRIYSLQEAIDLAIKTGEAKFDSTVELHVNLSVDPKQADQNIRDNLVLPAGTGKTIRIAVLAEPDDAKVAATAGADITSAEALLSQLDKEQIEFDVLIATPGNMAKLGKYARLLGPRGLMPNPKSGTVTPDVAKAVKEAKAGKVEYRVDEAGIVHLAIGKVSFGSDKIAENANAAITSIKNAKPASLKNVYIKSAHLTTTMGPSVKVDIS